MKKITCLLVFVFTFLMVNVGLAQDNAVKSPLLDGANAMINGITGGEISILTLTKNEFTVDKAGYTVISFRLAVKMGDDLIEINTTGNKISDRQAFILGKKNPGEKVYFEEIICKDVDGNAYALPPMTFVIK